jgi:integrase/recombinase XerD
MIARALSNAGMPDAKIPRAPAPRPCTIVPTPEELQRLIARAEPWMHLFLLLTSTLGLRFAEAASIGPSNWNREEGTITFRKKGGDMHKLPITPEIEQLFKLAPETEDPAAPFLFRLANKNHLKHTRDALRYHWKKLREAAGVRKEITPHAMRRLSAISLYQLTKDIRVVQHLLGHQSLGTTAWYLQHFDQEKLRPLLDQLSYKGKETIQ